ncbi:hypothetical protein K1D77_23205, partial [Escherichia coli]|nr:hypothetical protein [Escherichia coli]MBW8533951.1 hypothetical protein [Escherichia coli]MBW8582170.1 hypothetical protein [Escherichia coli]MBW8590401.1 hypothetical protein [Escherichia coli]MBW8599484.1 hypothetical protein [Escherichia coli]
GFIVGGPVGDFELLLCHGTVCVVGKMRDLILQLSKSSIYSTKPQRHKKLFRVTEPIRLLSDVAILVKVFSKGPVKCHLLILKLNPIMQVTAYWL